MLRLKIVIKFNLQLMKKRILFTAIVLLLMQSCSFLDDWDREYDGITVSVWNETRYVLDATLYIGALKNSNFIPTDSVPLDSILIRRYYPGYYTEKNRWNPQLNLITNLKVDSAYFKIKLSNNRSALLQSNGIPAKLYMKDYKKIESREGELSISIFDNLISGHFYDGNTYEGFRFSISNTDKEFENAKILIGGKRNNKFIATDSIILPKIYSPQSSLSNHFQIRNDKAVKEYFYKRNRWKPNLDLIRAIPSDSCYFKLVLPDGRESLLKNNKGVLAKTELPIGRVITNSDGFIQIQIQKDSIKGNFLVYNKAGLN